MIYERKSIGIKRQVWNAEKLSVANFKRLLVPNKNIAIIASYISLNEDLIIKNIIKNESMIFMCLTLLKL